MSLGVRDFLFSIRGDLTYALLLVLSAAVCFLIHRFRLYSVRRRFEGFVGLAICLLFLGRITVYSAVVVAAHLLLFRKVKCPKLLTKASFFGTFAYLLLLRCIHLISPLPKLEFIANAVQLLMTLRAIGLSYEIADSRTAKKDGKEVLDRFGKPVRFIEEPSTLEAFNYLYGLAGLFTGPYYTYQMYSDSLNYNFVQRVPVTDLIADRLSRLKWSLPALLFFYWLAPVDLCRDENVNDHHILVRFVLAAAAFAYLRMRIYTAWAISESICIGCGIGVYPVESEPESCHGPRNTAALALPDWKSFNAEAINNLDILHVEWSDGFRSGMRAWNRSVQFWLASFVYKRSSKAIRMPYTMFISAFWHGIHPGYFLSFLTIPLCTAAEDIVFRLFPEDPETKQRNRIFQQIWIFIRCRGFEMLATGFLLLTWEDTVRLWGGFYWWLQILTIAIIALDHFRLLPAKPKEAKKKE